MKSILYRDFRALWRERPDARLHLIADLTQGDHVIEAPDSPAPRTLSDEDLATRIARGDHAAFEMLMRQFNRQLFRVARGILGNDCEAEEALQEAYVTVYRKIGGFHGDSKLSTWLTRVVINEALGRLRKQRRERVVIPFSANEEREDARQPEPADDSASSPEESTLRAEMRALLELKIDELPLAFRTVFIMRELEELSVDETSECLGIPEATVRTRLFRAKALLREALAREIDIATPDAFAFAGERCDRIVAAVLSRVSQTIPDA
jgi:RNA polymerase sigma-70 factor (ECF subfamily)